jgi:hypothetical protein
LQNHEQKNKSKKKKKKRRIMNKKMKKQKTQCEQTQGVVGLFFNGVQISLLAR